jgi:hypothetical protein
MSYPLGAEKRQHGEHAPMGVGCGGQTELLEDVRDVLFDRALGDNDPLGDSEVRKPPSVDSACCSARAPASGVKDETPRQNRVIVTATIDGSPLRIIRAVNDEAPREVPSDKPIVLSQGEIERLGVDAAGRLRMLDDFRNSTQDRSRSTQLEASIRSISLRMQEVEQEIAVLGGQLETLIEAPEQLAKAEARQAELTKNLEAAQADDKRLSEVADIQAKSSVRQSVLGRTSDTLHQWAALLEDVAARAPGLENWVDDQSVGELLDRLRTRVVSATAKLREAISEIESGRAEIAELRTSAQLADVALADEARTLRRRLEEIQEGASEAARLVAQLRERTGQRAAITNLRAQRMQDVTELRRQRMAFLDALDETRLARFLDRDAIAQRLRAQLGSRIDIQVLQDADNAHYAAVVTGALRGSGLHYSTLIPSLTDRVSPRELAEAIELGDPARLAELTSIAPDRAAKVVDYIRQGGTADILTAPIEDSVEFSLLDGKDYKATESLSTGQRCTVILPIFLAHQDRVLVVDEPEAHLDNAFVVGTLINTLRRRDETAQYLLASHNANIHVLGEADRVIVLGSSGQRGFEQHSGHSMTPP